MVAINALIPRQRLFDGVPTSIPFTYRDGLTTLQLIECLKHNLDTIQRDLSKLEETTTDLAVSVDKALTDTVVQINQDMAALRAELLALIHEMEQQGSATSPVYGITQPLGQVLGGMYDNSRNHGLFWGDYDDMQLTAQEYDGLTLNAREYDLKATAVDNCVPGDFPGRSQFPYGRSMRRHGVYHAIRSGCTLCRTQSDRQQFRQQGVEMTATNHTENYDLSQFVGTDRPTWLGDYNGDMAKIDIQLKQNADDIASAAAGGLTSVNHTADLTGNGTSGSPLGVANTIARKTDIPNTSGFATTSALTSGLAGKVDKTASQPGTLGLTATELDSLYKDANGIVRVGTAK